MSQMPNAHWETRGKTKPNMLPSEVEEPNHSPTVISVVGMASQNQNSITTPLENQSKEAGSQIRHGKG